MSEYVIIVNERDTQTGICEKHEAHRKGLRHRAFSVILFQGDNILLQQRNPGKYHSGGLWANAACGHPRPEEPIDAAATRRLNEEMGIVCPLVWNCSTQYNADLDNGMIENEVVHLFFGTYDGPIRPNQNEVVNWKWADKKQFFGEVEESSQYTYWIKDYVRRGLIS